MRTISATYVRDGDQVLAFYEDKLIAHGSTFAAVEESAVDYLSKKVKEEKTAAAEKQKRAATHVTHPSGMKGRILGNVPNAWGEREVTVRWDNGRISKYVAHGDDDFKYTAEVAEQPSTATEYFDSVLSKTYEHDKRSLTTRVRELTWLQGRVAAVMQTDPSPEEARKLDSQSRAASLEATEIQGVLAHLEQVDTEAFAPPAPFKTGAVEQADLGGGSGTWLDETVTSMVAEAEAQDLNKLLLEEPGQFVAGVETAALGSAGVVQDMALSHITSKTAGLVGEEIDKVRSEFVSRVEIARRAELKERIKAAEKAQTKVAAEQKEASSDESVDSALFI